MIPWDRMSREEKALEVAGMIWIGLIFLGPPVLLLVAWIT